jgi:hypothetical protein
MFVAAMTALQARAPANVAVDHLENPWGTDWALQLPGRRRRWLTLFFFLGVGVGARIILEPGSIDQVLWSSGGFLAVLSGVSGLWSP